MTQKHTLTEPRVTLRPGGVYIGDYVPGNGTRYTAVAVRWQFFVSLGVMGCVPDGWLVVSGNSGKAYLFQAKGPLMDEYIQEHLGGFAGDYPYFGDLIRKLVDRE